MSAEGSELEHLTPRHGKQSPEEEEAQKVEENLEVVVLDNPRTESPQNQIAEVENKEEKEEQALEEGEPEEVIANSRTESPQEQQEEKKQDAEAERVVLAEETDGG